MKTNWYAVSAVMIIFSSCVIPEQTKAAPSDATDAATKTPTIISIITPSISAVTTPEWISEAKIAWGEKQVAKMLKDRPAMKPFVSKGDLLWKWAVEEFAGKHVKPGIEWDGSDPKPLWEAVHLAPFPPKHPRGRVWVTERYVGGTAWGTSRKGQKKSGQVLWMQVALEILNIQNYERFNKIDTRAAKRKSTRESFAIEKAIVESELWEKLDNFNETIWKPNCAERGQPNFESTMKEMWLGDRPPVRLPEDHLNYWLTNMKTEPYINHLMETYDEYYSQAYRKAESREKVFPVRSFLKIDATADLKTTWGDTANGATITAKIDSQDIEIQFESGMGWGCGISIPSNMGPYIESNVVDLRGYDLLRFEAQVPKGVQFEIRISELGAADPSLKSYKSFSGADGESYSFPPLVGTGEREIYKTNFSSAKRRIEWGNQNGNKIIDLQATSLLDFAVLGNQGNGKALLKDIEFRSK